MLKKLGVSALLAMTMATGVAVADTKIALVNPDRILRESAPAEAAHVLLQKEFASREKALAKAGKDLKAEVEAYQKKRAKLSQPERTVTERRLADAERRLQRQERELREDLNRRRNEELQSILMRTNDVIREIAEKEKYDLIVQEAVYFSPRIDITDKVIKALGKGKK